MANPGINQSQKQFQGLVLTPQLRQSLRILQVPAAELLREISEEMAANPLTRAWMRPSPPTHRKRKARANFPLVTTTLMR